MSREREADRVLVELLKTELENTTAERVISLMALAMQELAEQDLDNLRWYWKDGAVRTSALAATTGRWG